jgi:PhnB protein
MTVKPIPDGYGSAIPYLIVRGAGQAIDFYTSVFGATEVMRFPAPDGRIGHAELKIGNGLFMLADEHPELGHRDPRDVGGTPVSIMVYVPDVDALVRRALKAGSKIRRPLADQFYGDRSCTLEDPFGHVWHFATHKEDVSAEEMTRRMRMMRERESA